MVNQDQIFLIVALGNKGRSAALSNSGERLLQLRDSAELP